MRALLPQRSPGSLSMPDLLQREIAHITHMQGALKREYQALQDKDLATLDACIADKQRLHDEIETLERQRHELLRGTGYSPSAQGMEAYVRTHPATEQPWRQVVQLTGTCHYQNQLNGSLIDLTRRHVKRLLSLLHGQAPDQELYGPGGQTRTHGGSRTVITA